MAGIPAFCEKCKLLFDSKFIGAGSGNVMGCAVGCPKCREKAIIPDGFYNNIGGAIAITVENQSIDDIKKIVDLWVKHKLNTSGFGNGEVAAIIKQFQQFLK